MVGWDRVFYFNFNIRRPVAVPSGPGRLMTAATVVPTTIPVGMRIRRASLRLPNHFESVNCRHDSFAAYSDVSLATRAMKNQSEVMLLD